MWQAAEGAGEAGGVGKMARAIRSCFPSQSGISLMLDNFVFSPFSAFLYGAHFLHFYAPRLIRLLFMTSLLRGPLILKKPSNTPFPLADPQLPYGLSSPLHDFAHQHLSPFQPNCRLQFGPEPIYLCLCSAARSAM